MSWKASGYVKTITTMPNTEVKLRPTQKLLLMILADYYNDEEGAAWPSMERLATECVMSRRSAITIIQELEAGGIITVEQRLEHGGRHKTNRYRFTALSGGEAASPSRVPKRAPAASDGEAVARPDVVKQQVDGEAIGSHKPQVNNHSEPQVNKQVSDVPSPTAPTSVSGKTKRKYSPEEREYQIAQRLAGHVMAINPNRKPISPDHLQTWADTVRLMHEQDKQSHETIIQVIDWAMDDIETGPGWPGWAATIQSMPGLRKNWDAVTAKMHAKMLRRGSTPNGRSNGKTDTSAFDRAIRKLE